jgi:hypothetical protein
MAAQAAERALLVAALMWVAREAKAEMVVPQQDSQLLHSLPAGAEVRVEMAEMLLELQPQEMVETVPVIP